MLDDIEIEKVIQDIESGVTDYGIGKKHGHSPHTISTIRKSHEETKAREKKETGKIDVDALNQMDTQMKYENDTSPARAQVEKAKVKEHSERVINKAEAIIGEEDEALARGIQIVEAEKKQKIIDEYYKKTIQPLFNVAHPENSTWYTRDMVVKFVINPFSETIGSLEQQIDRLKAEHKEQIIQLEIKHKEELEQVRSTSYWDGAFKGAEIFCYVCGEPLAKAHLCIPCTNCFNQGWTLQAR